MKNGSVPLEGLCCWEKGKKAEKLHKFKSVSYDDKNIIRFIVGNLKNYYNKMQKVTSGRVLLDIIKNSLKINF